MQKYTTNLNLQNFHPFKIGTFIVILHLLQINLCIYISIKL